MSAGDHVIITTNKGRAQGTCCHVWRRGQCSWITGSSGPKDNMVNDAMALMDKCPAAGAVALMSLPGPQIMYLLRAGGEWRDILGVRPIIEVVE